MTSEDLLTRLTIEKADLCSPGASNGSSRGPFRGTICANGAPISRLLGRADRDSQKVFDPFSRDVHASISAFGV